MKWILILYFFTFTTQLVWSQSIPDSLKKKYGAAISSAEKGQVLSSYITSLKGSTAEQLKILLTQLTYFSNKRDQTGIGYTQLYIGISLVKMGDPNESLHHGIEALKIFEEIQDTFALLKTYTVIGNSYSNSGNLEESIGIWKKALPVARSYDLHYCIIYLDNMASCLNEMHLPDSAMPYIQEALNMGYKRKDSLEISPSLGIMGETYLMMAQNELARSFFRQSISFQTRANNYYSIHGGAMGSNLNGISQSFYNSEQYDSSLFYARQALSFDYPEYLPAATDSYELMYMSFDKENRKDSSNEYFRRATETKNSVVSDEKSRNIQIQHFKEELRQQEMASQKAEQALKHRENIENALIALGIISFAMIFLIMSHSFITNERLIRFMGILALLMVFEFINLLVHTYLEELTNHSQVLVLFMLVGIAALLIPLHHRLEKWAIVKLIEKNKRVRLAAAKLTIEKLEAKS
jgi:tetratricopeptide (TPR) repeat protein